MSGCASLALDNDRSALDPMENTTRFGNYQIIRKIGGGGMADVYEAVRIGLENFQTRVALKCILPSMTRDERFVKMFINEARLGSQLQHPNIIQIQDFNKVNDIYYIAMEYVDGVDLARMIRRLKARGLSFPPGVVVDLGLQALAGLGHAHGARWSDGNPMNIIHRDVKPSNLLITPAGLAKIGDFGIAKAANSSTSQSLTGGQIKGTIHYMSPEQVDGVPLTPASDLFCLGAILFEMLTLRPLFAGPTMSAILLKIVMVNIDSDLQQIAKTEPAFESLLLQALAADPKDRYTKASDMADALSALARQIDTGENLRKFLERHPEMLQPVGTQPGDEEDEDGSVTAERRSISLVGSDSASSQGALGQFDDSQVFEVSSSDLEGATAIPEEEDELPDSSAGISDDESDVAFDYYPPDEAAAMSELTSLPEPSSADAFVLSEMAQDLLPSSDDEVGDDLEVGLNKTNTPPPVRPPEDALSSLFHDSAPAPAPPVDLWLNHATEEMPALSLPPSPPAPLSSSPAPERPRIVSTAGDAIDTTRNIRTTAGRVASIAPAESAFSEQGSESAAVQRAPRSSGRVWRTLAVIGASIVFGMVLYFMANSSRPPVGSSPTPAPVAAVIEESPKAAETPRPAASPSSPVQLGYLDLETIPTGATVKVTGSNGAPAKTPAHLPLPSDQSRIEVTFVLPGFKQLVRTFDYRAGQSLKQTITLEALAGQLRVDSTPDRALILLGDKPTDRRTPHTFTDLETDKTYRVRLELAGYKPYVKDVRLSPGEVTRVNASLVATAGRPSTPPPTVVKVDPVPSPAPVPVEGGKSKATLKVNATPLGEAQASIDGGNFKDTPIIMTLEAGNHTVEWRSFSGKIKKLELNIDDGQTCAVVWPIESGENAKVKPRCTP